MDEEPSPMEERVGWLEREVADLSTVVASQDAELRRLTALVDRLASREAGREAEGSGGAILGDERPPHW